MRRNSTIFRVLALATILTMIFGMTALAADFEDVAEDHWAKEAIDYVVENDILPPTSETTFSPSVDTTRAEYVRALAVIADADVSEYETSTFDDVDDDSPFMPYIEWAADVGVVTGKTAEIYDPEGEITREQMSAMMFRLARYLELAPPEGAAWMIHVDFEDLEDVQEYAFEGVAYCYMKGVMTGMPGNLFDPQGNTTRAQAATILQRFYENVIAEGPPEEGEEGEEGEEVEEGQDPVAMIKGIAASAAETAASNLTTAGWGDMHEEMFRGGEGTEFEGYAALELVLTASAANLFANDDVLYVYALVPAGSDAEPPYAVTVDVSADALDYGTEFMFQAAFETAWSGDAVAAEFAWENADGELYWTGYAPVYDGEGLVAAIVAISVPASEIEEFPDLIQSRGIIEG